MDSHHFMLKVSRLFPFSFTSCRFGNLPDVAESSITITKSNKILHENDCSSSFNRPPNPKKIPKYSSAVQNICPKTLICGLSSDAEGRKCPRATPVSTINSNKVGKFREKISSVVSFNHSISSNSGWFTSSDEKTRPDDDFETDTFLSLSSNSGDSFRQKTSRRFRRCKEMKSIDEIERCSFSSVASFDKVPSRCSPRTAASGGKTIAEGNTKSNKTWPENELGSDRFSTQLYYHNNRDSGNSSRRRKTAKNSRKISKTSSRRSCDYSSMIEESYLVEKDSSDPHSDFRTSMVEMIVAKRIFAAKDLERLLLCFLSLNAVSYHGIIYDVFSEIYRTLFSN